MFKHTLRAIISLLKRVLVHNIEKRVTYKILLQLRIQGIVDSCTDENKYSIQRYRLKVARLYNFVLAHIDYHDQDFLSIIHLAFLQAMTQPESIKQFLVLLSTLQIVLNQSLNI